MPDLDAAARDFYNEIRALSMDTGGSIENILDNIGASSESLASLIPYDKREQLANFEMNLKQMIEEAKQLAASPRISMESLNMGNRSPFPDSERRSRKSLSVASQPDSVVSVIEARGLSIDQEQSLPSRSLIMDEEEPRPMSLRGRPTERSAKRNMTPQKPPSPPVQFREETPPLQKQESIEEQEQEAPPLEELEPPPAPAPRQTSTPRSTAPGRRGAVINREPSVGTDRYEEIIVETRKRSMSRGPSSRMGSRTSSQMDFRTSQDFSSSIGKLDLDIIRNSTKNITALDLDTRFAEKTGIEEIRKRSTPEVAPKMPTPEVVRKVTTPEVSRKMPTPEMSRKISSQPPAKMAFDANQNATAPTLPRAPSKPKVPPKPDTLVELFPKNIPHWFVITYTYSVVLILILLIANSTPDGKLYIHFTAFWSLVLYFLLEDDQVNHDFSLAIPDNFLIYI